MSGGLAVDFIDVDLVVESAGLFSSSAGLEASVFSSVPVDLEWTDTDHLV